MGLKTKIILSLTITGVSLGLLCTLLLSLADDPYEITRLRNSLLAEVGTESDFKWLPEAPPAAFKKENGEVPKLLKQATSKIIGKQIMDENLTKALLIGQHLAEGPGPGGGGILSDTMTTYKKIRTENKGYCADYTQVMNGLAYTANIPIREWGMSFNGFSGNGHAFSEIYDHNLKQWIFLDTFYGFFVRDKKSGKPLSVLEFRNKLLHSDTEDTINVSKIDDSGHFGFKSHKAALDYYRKGTDQFYMWFGNNVFSYDEHPAVQLLGKISRALEQGAAILLGIHPEIRIYPSETNSQFIEHLFLIKKVIISIALLGMLLGILVLLQINLLLMCRKTDL